MIVERSAGWPSRLQAFKMLALLMATMIAIHAFNAFVLGHAWDRYGIRPRGFDGLWPGVVAAPFLHISNLHLWNNLVVLAMLGGMTALVSGNRRFLAATAFIVLAGGAATWLLARSGSHIGASGLVFGYFGFLVGQGLFRRSLLALAVAGIVTFLYGVNIFFGIVFPKGCTSWEAHLAGAVAGLAYARLELFAARR
ncbi:MAG TPA: rhomboid family intramembrane serine protease [Burkholderiales bacterium]|nr:rhomboid family intramembrane serine protease [Burkholderiales bacterium]